MKKFTLSILLSILSLSGVWACGYYPYGEDIRISLLQPSYVYPNSVDRFFYTSNEFSNNDMEYSIYESSLFDENVDLWFKYLDQKVEKSAIFQAIYKLSAKDIQKKGSSNGMVKLLKGKNYSGALDYLLFAKKCEAYNFRYSSPWEKEKKGIIRQRKGVMKKALSLANKAVDLELKKRYAHLAIRLAFYGDDVDQIQNIYSKYFADQTEKNAIDYWALHFKIWYDEPGLERGLNAARVFLHSPEKRYATHQAYYGNDVDFEQLLAYAKTEEDRMAVHFTEASLSRRPAWDHIKELKKPFVSESDLVRITLREINKAEDWILTPYYTIFEPSTNYSWEEEYNYDQLQKRIASDRRYVLKIANWMEETSKTQEISSEWWSTMELYARFLAKDYAKLTPGVESLKKNPSGNGNLLAFQNKLFALTYFASVKQANLEDKEAQNWLLKYADDSRFLFCLGRELEFKGRKTDAVYVLSHVNHSEQDWSETQFWKTNERHQTLGGDYYTDYFFYLDAAYTITEMKALLTDMESEETESEFNDWKLKWVSRDKDRLYDLLGTKYFRKDDLRNALKAYEKVNESVWKSDNYPYAYYLAADPFELNFFGYDSDMPSNKSFTKPEILRKMIDYKEKTENKEGNEKARAAFHLANAYRNMSQHGNAWLMRRYFWTSTAQRAGLEDDDEYLHCNLAKKYYLIANQSSKVRKFAALSMRLAGTCEIYRLLDGRSWEYLEISEVDDIMEKNDFTRRLKREYKEDYRYLSSGNGCEYFGDYYASIRE